MSPVRRWLWALGAVVVVLAVVLGVVLATRDDDDNSATTTTTSATSTTAAATTTTTTTKPATSTTVGPTTTTTALPVLDDNPQTYAEYLYAAWRLGDQTAAAKVASSDAVAQIFAQAYPAQGPYTFSQCGAAAGSLYCTWNGQNGATLMMQVRTLTGGLPIQVEMVQFSS